MTARERLLAYLKRSRLNHGELAQTIGINFTHLSKILNGHRRPGLNTATRIERVTGIPAVSWTDMHVSRLDRKRTPTVRKPHVGNEITGHATS